jgi:hypothetical protein
MSREPHGQPVAQATVLLTDRAWPEDEVERDVLAAARRS